MANHYSLVNQHLLLVKCSYLLKLFLGTFIDTLLIFFIYTLQIYYIVILANLTILMQRFSFIGTFSQQELICLPKETISIMNQTAMINIQS